MTYYSQFQQDRYIDAVFGGKTNGVFVDIGAHDGVTFSNSCFFERVRGWRGVCVEPIPEVYARLQENRDCICVNACVSTTAGTRDFLKIVGSAEMLSGICDQYHPDHVQRIEREMLEHGDRAEIVPVQSVRAADLFADCGFGDIDYCSIDVEGAEWDVLNSIEFDSVRVKCFSVENNYGEGRIREFMSAKGYALVQRIECDDIFVTLG